MWGTSVQFLSFRTKMYILEMISGTAFGRLLHCKGPVKQAIFMVYWTKKRRVHLWRLGFYSNSPKWFLSEQATLARQYLTLFMMFLQCSPVLSLSLPSKLSAILATSDHLLITTGAAPGRGQPWRVGEGRFTAEGHSLPFLTVLSHMRTCGAWQQQPCYGWCCRKTLSVPSRSLSSSPLRAP